MRAAVIYGKAIAADMWSRIAADYAELAGADWQPRLVSASVGDTAAAELYMRNQMRRAESAGVAFDVLSYPAETSQEQLTGILQGLNADPRVNGIIIQRPLPRYIPVKALQLLKDVEGRQRASIGNIGYSDLALGPCTAVAAVEILKTLPLPLQGLDVTVIGHSEIVGNPLAFLVMGLGATVTVCHHMTLSVVMHSQALCRGGQAGAGDGQDSYAGGGLIDIGISWIETPQGAAHGGGCGL